MDMLKTHTDEYKRWADQKLESFTNNLDDLSVEIRNPLSITKSEKNEIRQKLTIHNLVFFSIPVDNDDKLAIKSFASQIGLGKYEYDSNSDADGLTEIRVSETGHNKIDYIPYTNKTLKWHTDGYYNDSKNSIESWMLYCNSPGAQGGTNKYFDHEIAYILFNQKFNNIEDLMLDNTYTIPKNELTGRKQICNPVFRYENSYLYMKFTMREKNILWNEKSLSASKNLKDIIEKTEKYHVCNKFTERQGVITNNVVHMRTSFTNSENNTRLLYRLRSKKRVI